VLTKGLSRGSGSRNKGKYLPQANRQQEEKVAWGFWTIINLPSERGRGYGDFRRLGPAREIWKRGFVRTGRSREGN